MMFSRCASVARSTLSKATLAKQASSTGVRAMSTRPEIAQAETMLDIGTRSIFDETHDMFRESARKFFAEECVPYHDQWEEEGQVSRELWTKAGELGLLGVTMPGEYGGAECDIKYSAIVWEEQSYTGNTGPGFALHSEIVMPYLLNYGSDEMKQKYLPPLISGEHIGAIAMTEPGAGSDLQGMRTNATKDSNGDWILNGNKTFITNGWLADQVIVCARTNSDPNVPAAHGISLFLIEDGMEGFRKGSKLKKMGMKAQDTAELFFDDVKVPAANLIGEENKGFYYLMAELPQERLLIADMAQASAEACFEWTREYVKDRKAFGKHLVDLQTIKHRLATMKSELTMSRIFVDRCIEMHASKTLDSSMASMSKYLCTDLQGKVADECVQLHGGWGYMWEYPVSKVFVDARVQRIYGGSNEIMKELISRDL